MIHHYIQRAAQDSTKWIVKSVDEASGDVEYSEYMSYDEAKALQRLWNGGSHGYDVGAKQYNW